MKCIECKSGWANYDQCRFGFSHESSQGDGRVDGHSMSITVELLRWSTKHQYTILNSGIGCYKQLQLNKKPSTYGWFRIIYYIALPTVNHRLGENPVISMDFDEHCDAHPWELRGGGCSEICPVCNWLKWIAVSLGWPYFEVLVRAETKQTSASVWYGDMWLFRTLLGF